MSKFKPGDKVTPINTDHCSDLMRQLMGKTLIVSSTDTDIRGHEVVWVRVSGGYLWCLYSEDLQLVSGVQTEPAPQKPLRRGDLVEYQGEICVVFSKGADREGDYRIASLTDKPDYFWASADELIKVGSIRKKIKRLQAQMGDCK